MPIPPALLARLQKRGISVRDRGNKSDDEEVFAEDYDDPGRPEVSPQLPESSVEDAIPKPAEAEPDTAEIDNDGDLVHEVSACPNKSNSYHECTSFCKKRWGVKKFKEDVDMRSRRERMISKYPLPPGWVEVGDTNTGRYYYWNCLTEQVSWLSPSHPRAIITQPAEKLKDILMSEERSDEEDLSDDSLSDLDSTSDSESEPEEDNRGRVDRKRKDDSRGGSGGRGRSRDPVKRGRNRKDDLDPMDPASYSDVPRGDWHSGLESRGDAKTGVDVTANGPLFQQRPYPSPGEVLRRNKSS